MRDDVDLPAWASLKNGQLRLSLKVQPNARRSEVSGPADGYLKVQVTAAAEDGKANNALIKLLAKRWKVAPGRFSLISGAKSRQKVIEVADVDQRLFDDISAIEETMHD